MFAFNTAYRAAACRSCGAYGGSQHQFSCQPGRVIQQGAMRRAARDARISAAVRATARIQDSGRHGR